MAVRREMNSYPGWDGWNRPIITAPLPTIHYCNLKMSWKREEKPLQYCNQITRLYNQLKTKSMKGPLPKKHVFVIRLTLPFKFVAPLVLYICFNCFNDLCLPICHPCGRWKVGTNGCWLGDWSTGIVNLICLTWRPGSWDGFSILFPLSSSYGWL